MKHDLFFCYHAHFHFCLLVLPEGLKDKDKKLIMNVLSAICLMKDQAYHLARHILNYVHDDWPFYTDKEKQILKRYRSAIKVKVFFFFVLSFFSALHALFIEERTRTNEPKKKPVLYLCVCHGCHSFSVRCGLVLKTGPVWHVLSLFATPCERDLLIMCLFYIK